MSARKRDVASSNFYQEGKGRNLKRLGEGRKKKKEKKIEKELQRETLTLLNFSCHHAISYL